MQYSLLIMLDGLLQDLRFGARMLVKAPAFTLVAALTLALGIGANTAIFSVVNALLLRTLPVQHPEQLAVVGDPTRVHSWSNGSPQSKSFSVPLYKEFAANNEVFSSLAATANVFARVRIEQNGKDSGPEKATARIVSSNMFETLGVPAALGRTFTADDDKAPGADPYTVISYAYWKRRFNQDPLIIGKTIRVNGYPLTIIGVAGRGFEGEVVGDNVDLWVPLMMEPQVLPGRDYLEKIDTSTLILIGRLKPGITLQQANAGMNVTFQRIAHSSFADRFDADNKPELQKLKIEVSDGSRGLSSIRKELEKPLWFLMGIVGLVLLIACVNVANLLLARSSARQTEMAVRLAIGASASRVARQLLTECVLLAAIGGALGLLASVWVTRALLSLVRGLNNNMNVSPDLRVLGFTAVVSILTGVLFGLAPALRARRMPLFNVLKEGGRSASTSGAPRPSVSRYLVAAQVALSVLVLFTSAILVRSLKNLQHFNTGYQRDSLLLLRIDGTTAGYRGDRLLNAWDELRERFRRMPGVVAVTDSENGLFSGSESADGIIVEGFTAAREQDKVAYDDTVGPAYFSTIGVPILMGREFGPQDTATSPRVVVINETMAHFYFQDANPIGRHITLDDDENDWRHKPFEIVGIVRDVHDHNIRKAPERRFYMPDSQTHESGGLGQVNFIIRVNGDPGALLETARKTVREFDPNLPITQSNTANQLVDQSLTDQIVIANLSGLFAALALLLACIGLYGLMSYSVAGRTREIGVRMALGATRTKLIWLVLREAMTMVVVGIVVGAPIAIASSRGLHSMLFEVTPVDPLSLLTTAVVLCLVATIAAFIPARRATRVDPMVALRYE